MFECIKKTNEIHFQGKYAEEFGHFGSVYKVLHGCISARCNILYLVFASEVNITLRAL